MLFLFVRNVDSTERVLNRYLNSFNILGELELVLETQINEIKE